MCYYSDTKHGCLHFYRRSHEMKLCIFFVFLLNYAYATEVLQTNPGASSAAGENANKLSQKILDKVFAERYEPLLQSLDTPSMKQNVEAALPTALKNQEDLVASLRADKKTSAKVLKVEVERLDSLKNFNADDYFKNIKTQVESQKGFNTISIKFSDGDMYVAANIKTASLPYSPDDPKMIQAVSGPGEIQWSGKEFGLQTSDGVAISKVLQAESALPRPVSNVYLVTPTDHPDIQYFQESALNAELEKLQVQRDSKLKELGKKHKKTSEHYQNEKARFDAEYESKAIKAQNDIYKDVAAVYHAEVVHVKHGTTITGDNVHNAGKVHDFVSNAERPLLGTSKALCALCENHVNSYNVFEYDQPAPGLKGSSVKNWGEPSGINLEKISLDDVPLKPSPDASTSKSTSRSGAASESIPVPGGCRQKGRRRRAAGSSCVFFLADDGPSKVTKVQEIDGDAFMAKYKTSPPDVQLQLSKVAASAPDAVVVGKHHDVDSVSKIVHHENIKTHEKTLKSASDALSSGTLDVDSVGKARISPTKTRFQMSKGLSKFTKNAGKVSGSLGKFLLAKGVVQGIANGDTTGLAIMGGRIGGEIALEIGGKYGAKVASKVAAKAGTKLGLKATAKFASKTLTKLSKFAGPIGAVADIGLSAWQLSSAVKRLNNPNATKWEQNEAIADIVGESLDIAITAVTTIASIAFPPLAPVFAVIGFFASLFVTAAVTLYKAQNHVNMLHSKIPLLAFEKDTEFGRHVIGKDTSAYITTLIETKFANNLAVNASIQLLESNPDIIGHVFPARTMKVQGNCKLTKEHCTFSIIECLGWEDYGTLASNCFEGGECPDYSERQCEDVSEFRIGEPWYRYKCTCSGEEKTVFGYPVSNQIVDFRDKDWVYLDRSIPDPPYHYNYEELCRPSSKSSKGYKISQSSRSQEYRCEGAIAIRRRSRSGKYMLFDLEDGTDVVWVDPNENTDNQFLVGSGRKEFHGGKGADMFVLTKCDSLAGTLWGGDGDNTLAVGDGCDKKLDMDMASGVITGNRVDINVRDINSVYGRRGKGDTISAACSTKYIASGGGGRWDGDTIKMNRVSGCGAKVTVVAESYTSVEGGRTGVESIVLIPADATDVTVSALKSSGSKGVVTAFVKHDAQSLSSSSVSNGALKLLFVNKQLTVEMASDVNVLLEESHGEPAQVILDGTSARCLHSLTSSGGKRSGCRNSPNTFQTTGGRWEVTGGWVDDTFYVAQNSVTGKFVGGGGTDVLHVAPSFGGNSLQIDIPEGTIKSSEGQIIRLESIEVLYGRAGKRDVIKCGCSSSFVSASGGASKQFPDEIHTEPRCSNVTVEVTGYSHVIIPVMTGVTTVHVFPQAVSDTKLTVHITPKGEASINLPFPMSSLQVENTQNGNLLEIRGSSNSFRHSLSVDMNFYNSSLKPDEYVDNVHLIMEEQAGAPSRLLVPRDLKVQSPLAFHTLHGPSNSPVGTRIGASGIPNYFRILSGNWDVVGGNKDDVFELQQIPSSSVLGGAGINDLRLTSPSTRQQEITVDLDARTMFGGGKRATVKDVQRFFGDELWKEKIWMGCDTQLIVTGGNTKLTTDTVGFKSTSCKHPTNPQIMAIGHTSVEAPTSRAFTIQVQPSAKNSLHFTLHANLVSNSTKVVLLQLSPHELTAWTDITQSTNTLSTHLTFGSEQHVLLHLTEESTGTRGGEEFLKNIQIAFTPVDATNGHRALLLFERKSRKPLVLHEIGGVVGTGVQGARVASNYFNIRSESRVTLKGGAQDDTFHVYTPFSGELNGDGGLNTIIPSCPSPVVNFQSGKIDCSNRFTGTFRHIQVGKGFPGKTEKFVVGCNTKLITSGGGENSSNPDMIDIGVISGCDQQGGPKTTILVEGATRVRNTWTGPGSFVYVVPQESAFDISLPQDTKANNMVRFQFGVDKVKSVAFSQNLLALHLRSGKLVRFPMKSSPPRNSKNPNIGFENGNDRLDLSVEGVSVRATLNIRDATSLRRLEGISGAVNDIIVNVTSNSVLQEIRGADFDDSFQLVSIPGLRRIDGSGGFKNQLRFAPSMWLGSAVVVDLRENGYLQHSSHTRVNLANIQIVFGRDSVGDDSVFISCDTLFVSGFQKVIVTKPHCDSYFNTVIHVGDNTQVIFDLEGNDTLFSNATFHYKFTSPRSFDVATEYWKDIRNTEQIFHLPFDLDQLDHIGYSNAELNYGISGTTYSHQIDTFLKWDQEFFESPKFQTEDGFQLKITRHGEIVVVSTIPSWSPMDDDEVATVYMQRASKLGVSFIINGKDGNSFIYAGHRYTRNVLTNTDTRSLLLGGGGNVTTYVITDLSHDVKIYPGFSKEDNSIHTLDLTMIIAPIREASKNSSKYVPEVFEGNDGSLEVWVEGYDGKVVIVDGVNIGSRIYTLLDAVAMTFQNNKFTPQTGSRRRRSINSESGWLLSPVPLVISEDAPINVMSLQDLELGQEIIFKTNAMDDGETIAKVEEGINGTTSLGFKAYRNGEELVLSNLGEASQSAQLLSITLLDAFNSSETEMLESIAVLANDTDEFPMTLSQLSEEAFKDATEDWEDVLGKTEDDLLERLPEVPRKFQLPLKKKLLKRYYNSFIAGLGVVAAIFVIFVCCLCKMCCLNSKWKYNLVINSSRKKKENTNSNEVIEENNTTQLELISRTEKVDR